MLILPVPFSNKMTFFSYEFILVITVDTTVASALRL